MDELIPSQDLQIVPDTNLISIAEQAEKRIEAIIKIKKIALMVTNKKDWVDEHGKPYLQVSGAEKVARTFGIGWKILEVVKENYDDGHFSYTYRGEFSGFGITIEAIGTRSSRDDFFKKYNYVNGQKILLPPTEIDPGDVKKSAYSNLLGNGITRILGIRNLTYDDLREYAGIEQNDITKIEYKKEGKKQNTNIESEEAETEIIDVIDIRKKEGINKKTNKPYTQYLIKSNDKTFQTFSETFAKFAKDCKELGEKVIITYKKNIYGYEIENITKMEK